MFPRQNQHPMQQKNMRVHWRIHVSHGLLKIPNACRSCLYKHNLHNKSVLTKGTVCTHYVDPATIELLVASRLIPLSKGEGAVRPTGVGEVIRRISGKCVIAKKDFVATSGSLQLCERGGNSRLCILHLKRTPPMPYCWLTPRMLSMRLIEQRHYIKSVFLSYNCSVRLQHL